MSLKKVMVAGGVCLMVFLVSPFLDGIHLFYGMRFYFLMLFTPLAMIYFFKMNNGAKEYFLPISISLLLYFLALMFFMRQEVQYIFMGGFLFFYVLRFSKKAQKNGLEIAKLTLILLFGVAVAMLFSQLSLQEELFGVIYFMLFWLYIIYIVEASNKEEIIRNKMKKLLVPAFVIQTVMCIGCLIFSVLKTIEAEEQRNIAEKQNVNAIEERRQAEFEKHQAQKLSEKLVEQRKTLEKKIMIFEDSIRKLKSK